MRGKTSLTVIKDSLCKSFAKHLETRRRHWIFFSQIAVDMLNYHPVGDVHKMFNKFSEVTGKFHGHKDNILKHGYGYFHQWRVMTLYLMRGMEK